MKYNIDEICEKLNNYTTAHGFDKKCKKIQDEIIKKDARWIYKFALNVQCADIEKLGEAIIKTGDGECIYLFARDIKRADIKQLEKAIIDIGAAGYIYCFALRIPGGANIQNL